MKSTLLILLLIITDLSAQNYSFPYVNLEDRYEVNNDNGTVYCIFRAAQTKESSLFSKVILDDQLKAIDSSQFEVNGNAVLIASGGNDWQSHHAFSTKIKGMRLVNFVITDKKGNKERMFVIDEKTLSDFFKKKIKINSNFQLRFLSSNDPSQLLIEVNLNDFQRSQVIFSCSAVNGSVIWYRKDVRLYSTLVTDSLIIGISQTFVNKELKRSEALHYINKFSGEQVAKSYISYETQSRTVHAITSDGKSVMLAGIQLDDRNKNKYSNHLFSTILNLRAVPIFDREDTTDYKLNYSSYKLGSTIDRNGNLVLLQQGFKIEWAQFIANAVVANAGNIAGGGYGSPNKSKLERRVDFISCAVFSKHTGDLLKFNFFPVGPWYSFARFASFGEHVLIINSENVLIFNANEPAGKPRNFSFIVNGEKLFMTPYGPAISDLQIGKKKIELKLIYD